MRGTVAAQSQQYGGPKMDQGTSRVRVEDIESAIAEVGDIKAARVVIDSFGEIQEVHVLALPSKQPKQLVRDIESTLQARFGIPIDHRKVSVALLGSDVEPSNGQAGDARHSAVRPRIVGINASVAGVQAAASVTLEIDGTEFVGTASGPASQTGRMRQVASATLDAIGQYVSAGNTFALEDVAIVQLGREKVAVACITLLSPYGEQAFSGSALVRQNEKDSIVRATLDAINRRMGLLTTE